MTKEIAPDVSTSNNIRTFLRIRPSKYPSGYIKGDEFDESKLGFHLPMDAKDAEYVNNTRTTHNFKFDGILGEKATQEDVFAKIGKGAVFNVLDGYNSTVFAYGQTGSGKTFTVTGGAERYVDRGIIPRALSLLFAEFKKRSDQQFTCHISYLEIYNEQGFDLLDPSHDSKKLEDLPKVSLMEDENGNIHLRNLSVYLAATEEEALNYLFLGDTNRAISETAMNKASSRSHCIFTMSVEGRKADSEKVTRSKLHLVDLAGSERVHKTRTGGQTLVEAKHINVSLFFLEMVIVALRERGAKGRQHIPYRNSMMTSVLRDSLGGNCKTVMIATVNAEAAQTEESMSTCRFAQRVSTIRNDARVNEDVDSEVLIRRLRSDCAALMEEVAFWKGETGEGDELTSEEMESLTQRCHAFVKDPAPNAQLSIGAYTLTKLRRCFVVFKTMVLGARHGVTCAEGTVSDPAERSSEGGPNYKGGARPAAVGGDGGQLLSMQDALEQRDREIAILVNMLKQGKCRSCTSQAASTTTAALAAGREHQSHGDTDTPGALRSRAGTKKLPGPGGVPERETAPKGTVGGRDSSRNARQASTLVVAVPDDSSVLANPQDAFAYFRERHPARHALEENKDLLREKYAKAKAMGERVNQARGTIQYLKNTIEQIRRERALDGLMESGGAMSSAEGAHATEERQGEDEVEEDKCKAAIEVEKQVYKGSFQELRDLKAEIEHIQRLLAKGRTRIQADFQEWYEPLAELAEHDEVDRQSTGHGTLGNKEVTCVRQKESKQISCSNGSNAEHQKVEMLEDHAQSKPTRRARPRIDAWEDPSMSCSRKASSPGHEGRGSSLYEDSGLSPSTTGNDHADDDIAAFYRAKEELERRRYQARTAAG